MKKKIIITMTILATLAISMLALVGCISKPPHKMFSDPWAGYEKVTYDAVREIDIDKEKEGAEVTINGTTTVTTTRINDSAVSFGDDTVGKYTNDNFTGTHVVIDTTMEDGSTMHAEFVMNVNLTPLASYKHIDQKTVYSHDGIKQDATEQTVLIKYNDGEKKCEYNAVLNKQKLEGTVKTGKWLKNPYFDNLMIYHVVRSSYFNGNFQNVTMALVSSGGDKYEKVDMIAQKRAVAEIKLDKDDEKGIKCDMISMTVQQSSVLGTGKAIEAYISHALSDEDKDKDYHGIKLTGERYLIKFIEGEMTYTISALEEKRG